MAKQRFICAECGKTSNRFGRWVHTYFEWNWWDTPRWMLTGKPGLHCWSNKGN